MVEACYNMVKLFSLLNDTFHLAFTICDEYYVLLTWSRHHGNTPHSRPSPRPAKHNLACRRTKQERMGSQHQQQVAHTLLRVTSDEAKVLAAEQESGKSLQVGTLAFFFSEAFL